MAIIGQVPGVGAVVSGPLRDLSGTTTLGGTAQTAIVDQPGRRYIFFQNISAENFFINFGVVAVADQPSIRVGPGASFVAESSFIPGEFISLISATTGSKFVLKVG